MGPIRTTLTGILAIAFAFLLIFGRNNDIFAQGYRKGAGTCPGNCDNASDDDGDGIPNGLDDDYVAPKDGTGKKYRRGRANRSTANTFLGRIEQGKKPFRSSFRFSTRGRIRVANRKHQNVAPALNCGGNLRHSTGRALTGTYDGTRKQVRCRIR